jgi:hypothetical protein
LPDKAEVARFLFGLESLLHDYIAAVAKIGSTGMAQSHHHDFLPFVINILVLHLNTLRSIYKVVTKITAKGWKAKTPPSPKL